MHYLSSKAETTASEDALCALLYGNGAELGGRMSVNYGWKKGLQNN
jgi:hypothetical protein